MFYNICMFKKSCFQFGDEEQKSCRPYISVPKHTFQTICWSAGIVGYFTYKYKTDWAIECGAVIGYEMPSALAARGRGTDASALHYFVTLQAVIQNHIFYNAQQVRLY